jgi:hypothetical protein
VFSPLSQFVVPVGDSDLGPLKKLVLIEITNIPKKTKAEQEVPKIRSGSSRPLKGEAQPYGILSSIEPLKVHVTPITLICGQAGLRNSLNSRKCGRSLRDQNIFSCLNNHLDSGRQ